MAYSIISGPGATNEETGEETGPCVTACEHAGCATSRAQAAALCGICGKRIGYDTLWSLHKISGPEDEADKPVHYECACKAIERRVR